MTKQEAIRILEQSCPKRPQKLWSIKRKKAVKMAIEALQIGLENVNADSCSEKPNRSDTIYRQDAIDVAKQHWYKPDIAKALEELPSAQEEEPLPLEDEYVGAHCIKVCPVCYTPWTRPRTSEYLKKTKYPFCPCGQMIKWGDNDE